MASEQIFYVGQKAFIEKDGKVLVVFDSVFGLDFPGGKINEDEVKNNNVNDLLFALNREVKEETGLEIEVGDPFAVWFFEVARKIHKLFGKKVYIVAFKCKYLSGDIKLSHEHHKFDWADKNNYKKFDDGSNGFAALEKYFSS